MLAYDSLFNQGQIRKYEEVSGDGPNQTPGKRTLNKNGPFSGQLFLAH